MKWLNRIRRKREEKALEVLRRTGTSLQEFGEQLKREYKDMKKLNKELIDKALKESKK